MIYFFGPDGTGKTTYSELLSSYLRTRGYRVWKTSIKQHHTFSYLLLKLLQMNGGKRGAYHRYFNGELLSRIKKPWKILELMSLLPAIIYRVYLPLLLGYIVICDRYVLDTLATLSYFINEPKLLSSKLTSLLIMLIPKESFLIYLDADTKVILKRKSDEPLTIHLIEYYKKAYKVLIRWSRLAIETIDTSMIATDDIQKTLRRHIIDKLR
jgi:thymidylate kinase